MKTTDDPKGRGRALRRVLRKRAIRRRSDRLKQRATPRLTRVWQLHHNGQALNIFHRQRADKDGRFACDGPIVVTEGEYSRIDPHWGGRHQAVIKPGMVWHHLRDYQPEHHMKQPGTLAKTKPAPRQHRPRGKDKNFKLLYRRPVKVHRARKLGFVHRPHADEREDEIDTLASVNEGQGLSKGKE